MFLYLSVLGMLPATFLLVGPVEVLVVLARDSEASDTINGTGCSSSFLLFLLPVIAVLSYTIIVSSWARKSNLL